MQKRFAVGKIPNTNILHFIGNNQKTKIQAKKIRGMPDSGHTPFTNAKIGDR